MKKIMKLAIVMLSAFSFTAVQAGPLTVTGTAKASYVISSSDSATAKLESAKGLGVANEFNLGASGELDNGYTWKYNINIDGGTTQDDGGLSLTTPYGSVAFNISQGGLELSKSGAVSAFGSRPSDTGYGEGMYEEHSIGDMNNIGFATAAGMLPAGAVIKFSYAPGTTADADQSINAQGAASPDTFIATTTVTADAQKATMGNSMKSYQIKASPIDGLAVGASYSEFSGLAAKSQKPESGSIYAKYVTGPVTVAAGRALIAHAVGAGTGDVIEETANVKMSLGFAVNDALSVSYNIDKSTAFHQNRATDIELKSKMISAAYTMGGMTFAVAQVNHLNVGYVQDVDVQSTVFNVAMAF